MLLRLSYKELKKNLTLNLLIMLLLMIIFGVSISAVSVLELRIKKYNTLKKYLDKKGIYLQAEYLAHDDLNRTLYRDEQELRQTLSDAEDILSVAEVWETYINGKKVNTWCYSTAVIDLLSPSMEDGRWFCPDDNSSKTLKVVVSHNKEGIKTGDIITIKSGLMDCVQEAEVIGVMKDDVYLYYGNPYGASTKDYRECFYTYDYKTENETPLIIMSDRQILGNQGKKWFPYLNYRLSKNIGFQKQLKSGLIITYPDYVSDTTMESDILCLSVDSCIRKQISLSTMKENSKKYIFKELYSLFPILVCIMIFIMIASISVGTISAKRSLKNYAIYYICGLKWTQCAKISLFISFLTASGAFIMITSVTGILQLLGKLEGTAITLGLWQLLICLLILILFVLLSWILPMCIVRHTSANEIFRNNI